MAYAFGAEDILAALGLTAATCEVQESANQHAQDWARTNANDGQPVAASETAHNKRNEKTITIKTKAASPAAATFTLGGIGTGAAGQKVVITAFTSRKTFNDNATLTVTAHQHDDAEAAAEHLATPVSQAISILLGFGVDAVKLGGTLVDCQSAEFSGQIRHEDKFSNMGKFLVGASTELVYNATEEYVDSGDDVTVADPWKQDTQQKRTTNQGFYTRVVTGHAFSLT